MKIFYFSATGNNLYIAKRLGGELYSIPQVLKNKEFEFEDEKIGIVFPCYGLGTPKIMEEFLEKVSFKAKYIFAIMTYGNISGNAIHNFTKIAKKNNVKIDYANELLMVDNYLPMFEMSKQKAKKSNKMIEENLNKMISQIKNSEKYICRKNIFQNLLSHSVQFFWKMQKGDFDKKFYVTDKCNSCGICEKVCAFNNIKVEGKPAFQHKCEQCMACINLCPQNAIHLKKEKSGERFINSNVKLAEIIESNNIKK